MSIKLQKTGDANGYWTTGSTFTANSAGATAISATSGNGFATWSADSSSVTFADGQSYTIVVATTDSAAPTGTSDTSAATRQFSVDSSAPTATVSSPTAAQFRSALATVTGTASDGTGAGVASVSIKLQKTGDANGYWTTGSTFTANSAGATAITATSGNSFAAWSADTSAVTFADGQSYTIVVSTTDSAAPTGTSDTSAATRQFSVDTASPTATITFPADGGYYNFSGFGGTSGSITGTAADTGGSGVATVKVSIQNTTTGGSSCYDGSAFTHACPDYLTATGTTSWSYALSAANLTDASSYTVTVETIDSLGNTNTSAATASFNYDTTAPTSQLGITVDANGTNSAREHFNSGTSTFYFSTSGISAPAGFSITDSPTDASGVGSVTFPDLSGVTGFTGSGGTDAFSPYSSSYTFSAAATAPADKTITVTDIAGNQTPDTLHFVRDVTGPGGGSVTANGSSSPSTSLSSAVGVAVTNFTDAGSGIASNVLRRYIADPVAGACPASHASYTQDSANVTLNGSNQDTGLQGDKCYFWRLVGTDRVANSSAADSSEVLVSIPTAPNLTISGETGSVYTASGSGTSSVSIFFRPASGASGSFNVAAAPSDSNTASSYTFPDLGSGWSPAGQTGPTPDNVTYSYTDAASSPGAKSVTFLNGTGFGSAAATLTVTGDSAAPTGGTISVPAATNSTSITITKTNYADAGSGIATNVITRSDGQDISGGGDCPTSGYTGSTVVTSPDTVPQTLKCYVYTLTGTDHVGNTASVSSNPVEVNNVAPVFQSGAVNGTTLTLTYNKTLAAPAPTAGLFTVNYDGVTQFVSGTAISTNHLILTVPSPNNSEAVTVAYAVPTGGENPVVDLAGNPASAFSATAVTNSTTDTVAPGVAFTVPAANVYSNANSISFVFHATRNSGSTTTETGDTFQCALNGGSYSSCSSPHCRRHVAGRRHLPAPRQGDRRKQQHRHRSRQRNDHDRPGRAAGHARLESERPDERERERRDRLPRDRHERRQRHLPVQARRRLVRTVHDRLRLRHEPAALRRLAHRDDPRHRRSRQHHEQDLHLDGRQPDARGDRRDGDECERPVQGRRRHPHQGQLLRGRRGRRDRRHADARTEHDAGRVCDVHRHRLDEHLALVRLHGAGRRHQREPRLRRDDVARAERRHDQRPRGQRRDAHARGSGRGELARREQADRDRHDGAGSADGDDAGSRLDDGRQRDALDLDRARRDPRVHPRQRAVVLRHAHRPDRRQPHALRDGDRRRREHGPGDVGHLDGRRHAARHDDHVRPAEPDERHRSDIHARLEQAREHGRVQPRQRWLRAVLGQPDVHLAERREPHPRGPRNRRVRQRRSHTRVLYVDNRPDRSGHADDRRPVTDPSNVANPSITFTSDAGVTFQCSLDGSAYAGCSSPLSVGPLADGSHTFSVKAIDAAGNVSPVATFTWTVDTTAPGGPTITSGPSNPSTTATPTFAFTGDSGSTFLCAIDSDPFVACSSPYTTSAIGGGTHTFHLKQVDAAGNTSVATDFGPWLTDFLAPNAPTITSGPASTTTDSTATFVFSSDEPTATLQCDLDAAGYAACVSPDSLVALGPGVHIFSVRAVDTAGNTGAATTYTWAIGAGGGGGIPPHLLPSSPLDGETVDSVTNIVLTADRSVIWSNVAVQHEGDPAVPLTGGSGNTLTEPIASPTMGLYTLTATISDGIHSPVDVSSHFTIWVATSSTPQPAVAANALPASATGAAAAGALTASDRSVTLNWPADAVPSTGMVIHITPVTTQNVTVPTGSVWTDNQTLVDVTANSIADNAPITWFAAPLEFDLPNAGPNDIPAVSTDGGVTWRFLEPLDGAFLPAGRVDGYVRLSQGLAIFTNHLTLFGLLTDKEAPSAPASLEGRIDNGQLVLRWQPATDNSGVIKYYSVWVDGQQVKTLGGSTYEYFVGPATTGDSHVYRVQATDAFGNGSPLSEAVTGVPNLIGKTQAHASAALQAAGFTDGVVTGAGSSTKVTAQSPGSPGYAVVGASVDFTLGTQSALRAPLSLHVVGGHRINPIIRNYVAVQVKVNLAAQLIATMRNSHEKIVALWTRNLHSGVFQIRYTLPTNLAADHYKLTVEARTEGSRQGYTIPVIVLKGKAPVVENAKVIVVGNAAGRSNLRLKLTAKANVVVVANGQVFDITGSQRRVAALVVDVDQYGLAMVHNLHIVFPSVKIVAVTTESAKVAKAKSAGATSVVFTSKSASMSNLVSGLLNSLLKGQ